MLSEINDLVRLRLGADIIRDAFSVMEENFIRIDTIHLLSVLDFLKNDPDIRLTLLDQLLVLPAHVLPWPESAIPDAEAITILYQLRSVRLPYLLTVAIVTEQTGTAIPSISSEFLGAEFHEADICERYGLIIE